MPNNSSSSNVAWTVLWISAVVFTGLIFSPLVIPAGKHLPMFAGMPYSLLGWNISFHYLGNTYLFGHPGIPWKK